MFKARISSVNRNDWEIVLQNSEHLRAKINNSYLKKNLPIVGDFILVKQDEWNNYFIVDLFKRKNLLKRYYNGKNQKIASNIDVVFLVLSLNKDFSIEKLERLILIGMVGKARQVILLSKKDLCPNYLEYEQLIYKHFPTSTVISIDNIHDDNLTAIFSNWKPNETAIFIGSSGVGKSTLINRILCKNIMKTAAIREKDDKGRHTTTSRELFIIKDGRVIIDTPGIRAIEITNDNKGVSNMFQKIIELEHKCKYSDCMHTQNNKGCAIWQAIINGELDIEEYQRYLKFKKKEMGYNRYIGINNNLKSYQKEQLCKKLKSQKKYER